MRGLNKVTLIGNLGDNPELRFTAKGTPVAQLSLATNEPVPDGNGGWKDHTEWHRIVAFGKLAENCAKHLAKGAAIHLEGRLQTRKWDANDGTKRYMTEIVAREVLFLGKINGGKATDTGNDAGFGDSPIPPDEEIPF